MLKRILVISGDLLPYPGCPTTGAGLRAWGLGKGLESKGHHVILAQPRAAIAKWRHIPDELAPFLYTDHTLDTFVRNHAPDLVVLQHWRLADFLKTPLDIPLIVDLHGPLLLEMLFQQNPALEKLKRIKISALRKADFFTCAGTQQRFYFEPWLLMAGVDLKENVICPIPVSLSPELPVHNSEGELTWVYGGVFLPWQDPTLALTTLVHALETRQQGRLEFFGGKHPTLSLSARTFERLVHRLERSNRVRLHPLIPRDQLVQEYCRAHVAMDVMQCNAERELAVTTRTVEYLWCGLPVIYNHYAELSPYIQRYRAGWTVDPTNQTALARVIEEILDDPGCLVERSRQAQQLVREHFTWDRAIAPLDAFCRNPVTRLKTAPMLPDQPGFQWNLACEQFVFHLRQEGLAGVLKRLCAKMNPS